MANVSTYMVLHVWEKASSVAGYDPDIWRKDFAGAWIRKDSYGLNTKYDEKTMINQLQGQALNAASRFMNELYINSNVVDNRYLFF